MDSQLRLLQDVEQVGHGPALDQGGGQGDDIGWFRLYIEWGQGDTGLALLACNDLDPGIGGKTGIDCGERGLHTRAYLGHERRCLPRLIERDIVFVPAGGDRSLAEDPRPGCNTDALP